MTSRYGTYYKKASVINCQLTQRMPDEVREDQQEEITSEPIPSSEKQEEVKADSSDSNEPTLPDGVKERTAEEFEKLKARNKALAEKLSQYEAPAYQQEPQRSTFDTYQPNTSQYGSLSQGQVENIAQSFVDKDGYVDVAGLDQALRQANANSQAAIDESRKLRKEVERFNHTQETSKTFTAFPDLDPDNVETFDEGFEEEVEKQIYVQLKRGQKGDFYTAAKEVAKKYPRKLVEAEKAAKVKQDESEASKLKRAQATTQVGQGKGSSQPLDQDELVDRSRKGDRDALYKRLRASGY